MADWAVDMFREHNREADAWAGKGVKGREEEWIELRVWSGPMLPTCVVSRNYDSGLH